MLTFLCYPRCSTCQKAKKWLEEAGIPYTYRDIQQEHPSFEELTRWQQESGLPMKKFFNTSGLKYKSLGLKDKLPGMTDEEMAALLSGDGLLVKRPLLVGEGLVLVGFRQEQWENALRQG